MKLTPEYHQTHASISLVLPWIWAIPAFLYLPSSFITWIVLRWRGYIEGVRAPLIVLATKAISWCCGMLIFWFAMTIALILIPKVTPLEVVWSVEDAHVSFLDKLLFVTQNIHLWMIYPRNADWVFTLLQGCRSEILVFSFAAMWFIDCIAMTRFAQLSPRHRLGMCLLWMQGAFLALLIAWFTFAPYLRYLLIK